jgi:pimeloyl-ACP methyl ester carboxylesterase
MRHSTMTPIDLISGTAEHPVHVAVLKAEPSAHRPPIVMLHGGFHDGTAYLVTPDGREGWAVNFAKRGHDVFVMDWPGHGRSPTNTSLVSLSMVDVGRSLGALLQITGPAVLLVHSAGGPIAWWVAEHFPAHVKAVVGIAPGAPANLVPVLSPEPPQSFGSEGAGLAIYAPTDRVATVDRAFIKTFWANSARFPHDAFEAYARTVGPESPRILNERFNIGGRGLYVQCPETLHNLPILVMTGDSDPRHPKDVDGALAQWLKADFMWLPDLGIVRNGHLLMLEDNHEELAGRISAWLDRKV